MTGFSHPYLLTAAVLLSLTVMFYHLRGKAMTAGKKTASAFIKAAGLTILVFLAGEGLLHPPAGRPNVVVLADFSSSIGPQRLKAAGVVSNAAVSAVAGRGEISMIRFTGRPVGENVSPLDIRGEGALEAGTNIEAALEAAAARFRPGGINRLVLLSDGEETAGKAIRALPSLKKKNIAVLPYDFSRIPDAEAELVDVVAPAGVLLGQTFEIKAYTASRSDGKLGVALYSEGLELERKEMLLENGKGEAVFTRRGEIAGPVSYSVMIDARVGDHEENNRRTVTVEVAGDVAVTLITEDTAATSWLSDKLSNAGMRVRVCGAEECLFDQEALMGADVIIIDNVSKRVLGSTAIERIETIVRENGSGLLVVGGEQSLGAGAYQRTTLERMLPVVMGAPSDLPDDDLGIVVVLDTSLSMYFHGKVSSLVDGYRPRKIEVARSALLEVVRALRPNDSMGLLGSADYLEWHKRPGPVVDVGRIENIIRGLQTVGGGINFYSSILEAYREIKMLDTPLKHVMVITDSDDIDQREVPDVGESFELIESMRSDGITLSIFAIGGASDKDVNFLRKAAFLGKGDFYLVADLAYLPKYFVSDYKSRKDSWIREERFVPLVRDRASIPQLQDGIDLPPLSGLNLAATKQGAREILVSPFGSPILSFWRYGRGRTAVFTADNGVKWAAEWRGWSGSDLFWPQMVYLVSPRPQASAEEVTAHPDLVGENLTIRIRRTDGALFDAGFRQMVLGTATGDVPLELERVGLETYRSRLPSLPAGVYGFNLSPGDGVDIKGEVLIPGPREYSIVDSGRGLLDTLAAETGGFWITSGEDVMKGVPREVPAEGGHGPLWLSLAALVSLLGLAVLRY